MGSGDALRVLGSAEDPDLIRTWLWTGLLYPFWHLLAPEGARDPWWIWFAIGVAFLALRQASFHSAAVLSGLRNLHQALCWTITLQLFVLATVNDMQPFYAAGSVLSALGTSLILPSLRAFLAYGAFVCGLSFLSFALAPSALKAAWWFPLPTLLAVLYYRLRLNLRLVDAVRQYQEDLEAKVAERTRQLSEANAGLRREIEDRAALEEQLRFSQRMEAVGRLAGGIAHDFNNLLTAIRGYADILRQELPEDSPLRGDVEQLRGAVGRSASLIRQLLAFSRQEESATSEVDPRPVLRELREMLVAVLSEDIVLDLELDEGCGCIRTDPGQLEQVILNLVLNARDAMPEGGTLDIEVTELTREALPFELAGTAEADCHLLMAFRDTGTGMDDETRHRVFEPFFTTKGVGQGTGLGLAMVYGIVTRAGGHVRVTSEPAKGSCFELYWPRVAPTGPGAAAQAEETPPDGGQERILLVEDEPMVRKLARRVLEGAGYRVVETQNAVEALEVAEHPGEEIDLVLTDAVMPQMSGLELAERLVQVRPGTPVLLMSGHLDHPTLRAGSVPAQVAFLGKPFGAGELCARVRALLDTGNDAPR